MNSALAVRDTDAIMERVIIAGDLAELQPGERVEYYNRVCESLGLNPLSRPFEYIDLNGKLTLYATRTCTDQLRTLNQITIEIMDRHEEHGIYVVRARARTHDGRSDESIGAVPMEKEGGEWKTAQSGKRYLAKDGSVIPLFGEERSNAMMKAETKAKRRVTLSICGLGWLDESEADSVPSAKRVTLEEDYTARWLARFRALPTAPEVTPSRLDALIEQFDQATSAGNGLAVCSWAVHPTQSCISASQADALEKTIAAATGDQLAWLARAANAAAAPETQDEVPF